MRNNNVLFDWNDITIVPKALSDIDSRSEINILDNNGKLPLIVSPMDTVVDENNAHIFLELGYEVCLPRGIKYTEELKECFFSFGLDEIIQIVDNSEELPPRVLIDIAQGGMKKLYNIAKKIKKIYEVELMVGNIANPDTYKLYCDIGVDYVRCSVGSGSVCTSSANTAINFPLASLIEQCNIIKQSHPTPAKIIPDGGFRKYADIIKAVALGGDYIMLGSVINKSLESCSDSYVLNNREIGYERVNITQAKSIFERGTGDVYKLYRGMSTKEVQAKWGRKTLKTAEGISTYNKVEYTISGWTENFTDYLKSNMSYTGFREIEDYKGNVDYRLITNHAYNRFNK